MVFSVCAHPWCLSSYKHTSHIRLGSTLMTSIEPQLLPSKILTPNSHTGGYGINIRILRHHSLVHNIIPHLIYKKPYYLYALPTPSRVFRRLEFYRVNQVNSIFFFKSYYILIAYPEAAFIVNLNIWKLLSKLLALFNIFRKAAAT